MLLDQPLIDELIKCQKTVIEFPSDWKEERGNFRISFELQSTDEKYFFIGFGRYNAKFNENFSFGLVFYPKLEKRSYEIVRCNGPHGEHLQFPHHIHYHIHIAKEERIEAGLKEDSFVEITTDYTNYNEAFLFFLRYINTLQQDIDRIFPPKQTTLFD